MMRRRHGGDHLPTSYGGGSGVGEEGGGGGGGYGERGYGGYGGGTGTGGGGGYGGYGSDGGGGLGVGFGSVVAPPTSRRSSSSLSLPSPRRAVAIYATVALTAISAVLLLVIATIRSRSEALSLRSDLDRMNGILSNMEQSRTTLQGRYRESSRQLSEARDRESGLVKELAACKEELEQEHSVVGANTRESNKAIALLESELERMRAAISEAELRLHRFEREAQEALSASGGGDGGNGGNGEAKDGGGAQDSNDRDGESYKDVLSRRAEEEKKRADRLREHIARESHRSALERFGPGPHNVTIRVELPADADSYPSMPSNPTFTIQLYPLSKMPHSVHLFLEQVAHGLWDGCSFIVNANHILQAGAHPGGAEPGDKMQPFEDMQLDVLSFQEYHEDYPHVPYTVGFAGRPGGPDFYINKIDNTITHGPHGQKHEILSEEADPCFGYVVDGRDVVDRLGTLPTDGEKGYVLLKPVHILEARIPGVDMHQ